MPSRKTKPKTFLEVYNICVAPKLREIDLFLKEMEFPAAIWQASQLLDMPYDEILGILHKLKIETLNKDAFLTLVMAGTSPICGLIQREAERGFPTYYTPDDISFIYEIDVKKITRIFERLGACSVNEQMLPVVFGMLRPDDCIIQNM